MEQTKPVFFFFCLVLCYAVLTGTKAVHGSSHHHRRHFRPTKLFVFGDSYADTGNTGKSESGAWKVPYGITFPGKPAGRFSDGRVLTDYLASFFGIRSPVPYKWRRFAVNSLRHGMNIAYGGSGVFDTFAPYPNMTTQIDFFQQLLHERVYTKSDLSYSVALVSVVGNDYSTYNRRNGSVQGLPAFSASVVNQIALNLKRIHGLGVKKVVITALQPLGCLPSNTASTSFQQCNEPQNVAVNLHNRLLQQAVHKLNNETKDSAFTILDLYGAFMDVFKKQGDGTGRLKFENPLKPCCVGIGNGFSCGSVDQNGAKKYTVCENPKSRFFWDMVHPSQEGWTAVYSVLKPSLRKLY